MEKSNWWGIVDDSIRDLVKESYALLEQAKMNRGFLDYSYVVFPAAKAYEGFLKILFWKMRLINSQQFYGEHFRIGRALSPTLPKRYRAGWVYGKLVSSCKGDTLPLQMWEVWKRARNKVFHYFPNHNDMVSLEYAGDLVDQITAMMEKSLAGCRI